MTNTEPVAEMNNVSVTFGGVVALNRVSISVQRGEVLGLIGHNGAGKSTLIRVLSGAQRADSGQIFIDSAETELSNPADAKRNGIETVYQTLALADNLDAVSNLFLGRELRRARFFRRDRQMRQAAQQVIERINPRFTNLKTPVKDLSGGQRQSIAIARAVHFQAKVIVLDEPTAALGPAETAHFNDLIARLKTQNVGIVLVSHDIDQIMELADRLVVMADGKVISRVDAGEASKDEILSLVILGEAAPDKLLPADVVGLTAHGGAPASPGSPASERNGKP
jgi:D-xylose transport system ATP-binding protein